MKLLIFMCLFIYAVGVHSLETEAQRRQRCLNQSGVDTKLFEELYEKKRYIANRELDCYVACMMIQNEILSEGNKVTVDHRFFIPEEKQRCTNLVGADTCETAGKIMACLMETTDPSQIY